jgi:ATP-binding cassette subfamily B protein
VVFTNIADVLIPKYVQYAVDALQANSVSYTQFIIPVVALLVLQFIGRIYWRQTLGQQTHFVAARMKSLLWDRARYYPKERLEKDLSPGELMSVATSDVGIARFMFGFTLVGTTDFIFLLTLSIIAMVTIDPYLTFVSLMILPLLPFAVNRLAKLESQQHRQAQEALSTLSELSAQAIATQRLQRVSETHTFWEEKLRQAASKYRDLRLAAQHTSLKFIPVTGLMPLISFSILLFLGVERVLAGHITLGEFVALQTYIFLVQQPLLELGAIVSEWQRGATSFKRVVDILRQPESAGLRSGGDKLTVGNSTAFQIRIESFSRDSDSPPILKNISLDIPVGGRLGISGAIGTGKSTLLEILSGLETRYQGSVLFLGRNLKSYSHAALRQQMAVVPQKSFLFGDTIRSNLSLDQNVSDEELLRCCAIAEVRQDVEEFPMGLDTRLGEWGVNLSGGQKQRLTLARALIRKPSVLLLDDCLSAVDTVTEERILRNLDHELKNSTLIWVAHRHSTLRLCKQKLELT